MNTKYYLTEVDKNPQSIFCYHNLMGETFIEAHSHNKGQFLYTEGGVVHVKTSNRYITYQQDIICGYHLELDTLYTQVLQMLLCVICIFPTHLALPGFIKKKAFTL